MVDIQKKMSRRHEGVHKTVLPQAPIASQRFLAVLTSQPRISRTLAIDRACDSGKAGSWQWEPGWRLVEVPVLGKERKMPG